MNFSWPSLLQGLALGLGSASGIRAVFNPAVRRCTKATVALWFLSYLFLLGALTHHERVAYYSLHVVVFLYRCLLLSLFSSRLGDGYGVHDSWKPLLIIVYTVFHGGWVVSSFWNITEECLRKTWTGLCHMTLVHRLFHIGTESCFVLWIMVLDSVFVYHLVRKLCRQHGLHILAFHSNIYHAFLQACLLIVITSNLFRLFRFLAKEDPTIYPLWQIQDVIAILLLTEFGCKYKLILSASRPDTTQKDLESAQTLLSRAETTKNNILRYLHHELRNNLQRMIYLSDHLTQKEWDLNKQSERLAAHYPYFPLPEAIRADKEIVPATLRGSTTVSAPSLLAAGVAPKNAWDDDTLRSIQTCSAYIASVVEDVLTIENYEDGTLALRARSYNLSDLIRSEFIYYEQFAIANGRRIEMSNTLPTSYVVVGDPDRVRQVLRILGESCIEKSDLPSASNDAHVQASAKVNGSLTVDLTAAVESIFDVTSTDPYALLPGDAPHDLSQSVVHRILKLLHGHLVLDQSRRHVRIIIPLEIDLCSESASSINQEDRCGTGKRLSILIVDDSRINRTILRKLLKGILRDQATILEAEDGQIAADLVLKKGHVFDVIWMDQVMPVKDGLTACHEIKAVLPTTVIVMVSANDMSGSPEMIGPVAPDDAILKPVNKTILETMLLRHKLISK